MNSIPNFSPLDNSSIPSFFDAVLVDDDLCIRKAWELAAKKQNKKIKTFTTASELFEYLPKIHPESPIYLDSNLSDQTRGEIVSKEIYDLGYKTLYLATGLPKSYFHEFPWILDIVGKNPPWFDILFT